jgi:hypothetical protein
MSSNILEEYLFALGFKMDEKGKKTFETTLKDFEKRANSLAKGLFQVAAATSTMVGVFAYQMEKLYYASKRIGSSVSNIQALEYGAEQIGISGETMRASLENLAKTIRLNPGIGKLIESFGVPVEGRDTSDVARDLVKALAGMPHYLGAQFAGLFGIDEQTLLMWKQGMGTLDEAAEKRKQMAGNLGVDVDAAAEASKDLLNTWRELLEFMKLFGALVVQTMLPAMKDMAGVVKGVLTDWAKILGNKKEGVMSQIGSALSTLYMAPFRRAESKMIFSDVNKRVAAGETKGITIGPAPTAASSPVASGPAKPGSAAADFAKLEQKYGLPAGLLDRIWQRESNRGQNMTSPAGAKGHFQFMDGTAAQYGVTDPNDLGQSSEGAARYMRDLLTRYGGDLRMATGAYNWGPGNMSKYGPTKAPAETQAYMDAVGGPAPQINVKTDIHVNGAQDPQAVAAEVERRQIAVNADLTRNLGGSTQ